MRYQIKFFSVPDLFVDADDYYLDTEDDEYTFYNDSDADEMDIVASVPRTHELIYIRKVNA